MFDVEVRVLMDGRRLALVAQVARAVRGEMQNLPQLRPAVAEIPWRERSEGERKGPKPLAVGPTQSRSA